MEFCDRCGGLMMPKRSGTRVVLLCSKCGTRKTSKEKKFKLSVHTEKNKGKIIVISKKSMFETLPKTKIPCPKCENQEAHWWMQQMRAADEPPTRFYKCTKCRHVWREYS